MKSLARVLAASLAPYGYALFALAFVACLGAGWLVVSRVLDARDARHAVERRSLRGAIAHRDTIIAGDKQLLARALAERDSVRAANGALVARVAASEAARRAAAAKLRVVGPLVVAARDGADSAAVDTLATDPRVADAITTCTAACAAKDTLIAALQTEAARDDATLGAARGVIAQQDTALALRDSLLALPERKRPRFGFKAGAVTGVVLTLGALKALASLTGAGLRRAIPGR